MSTPLDQQDSEPVSRKLTWDKPRAYLWTLLTALGWLLYFAATLSMPPMGTGPPVLAQAGSVLIGVLMLMAVLAAGARPRWPSIARWGMFSCGVLTVALAFMFNARAPELRAWIALGLMGIALPIGYWVGDRMEKVTNLIPVAVAFTFADIFSVYQGPSKKVVEQLEGYEEEVAEHVAQAISTAAAGEAAQAAAQAAAMVRAPLADYVIVHFPVLGTGGSVPVLGIGDFIIIALLFRTAWVHGLSLLAVLGACLVAVTAALVFSNYVGHAIPALPFIAVGVIGWLLLTNPRLRRLDRQEIVLSFVVAAIFIALIAGKYFQGLLG
jgi:hypothetical protein